MRLCALAGMAVVWAFPLNFYGCIFFYAMPIACRLEVGPHLRCCHRLRPRWLKQDVLHWISIRFVLPSVNTVHGRVVSLLLSNDYQASLGV